MMALKTAINEVRQELGIQEKRTLDNIEFLEEEYRQLKKQLTTKLDYVEIGMGTIKRDVKVMSSGGKRLDAVEENLRKLEEIGKRTGESNSCLKVHSLHTPYTEETVDLQGERLDSFREVSLQGKMRQMTRKNNSCMKETSMKRRPESDSLRQLKSQTEDRLDTLRRLECIPTKQAEEAKKLLEEKRHIVIKGIPGEGKTVTALHLIDDEKYRYRRVVVYYPRQWKTVDTDWVDIVVLEDIFGRFDLDFGCLQKWMVYLPTIQEHVATGKLQVIITTRTDILSKAYSKLGALKLFSNDLSLTLSSEKLTNSEKISILNRVLQMHKRNINEYDKQKCLLKFCGLIGFPQCCSLFAADSKLFDRGPEFFKSPVEHFVLNITLLEATRFLSLAFLFCHGRICEEYLSPETIPESSSSLLMELASCLHISQKKAFVTLLRDAYESFLGLYIVKSKSCGLRLSVEIPVIHFSHATVYDAVGQVLGERCPEMVVKYVDSGYLYQRTYTAEAKDDDSRNVFIPVSVYGLLARRMVHDVIEESLVRNVVKHSALKHHDFLKKLKDELLKDNRLTDFFIAKPSCMSKLGQDLSEGECITFMQCTLQSDEDKVRLVYNHFLEVLACTHYNNSSDCWQCNEKQKLLELALYYHCYEIADKLITMNACYTHVSLCNATRHGDFRRIQSILETLKRSQVFSPECDEAKKALCRAYISGNQSLIEIFLKEGITLDRKHLVNVIEQGNVFTLMKVVEHMKCHDNWNRHLEEVTSIQEIDENPLLKALYLAYSIEKFDMADYLVKSGVKASVRMLPLLSEYSSHQAVIRVIQTLKDTDNWNPKCFDASEALGKAFSQNKYDVCDLLIEEGISLAMKHLPDVVSRALLESVRKLDTVKKAIHYLKDTNNWNPMCDNASKALEIGYKERWYDVCDLLIQEGVSLTMENVSVLLGLKGSLEYVRKTIQHLKDTGSWNPRCDNASEALAKAYCKQEFQVCDLLIQEGVSLAMKHLPNVVLLGSSNNVKIFDTVKESIHHLKDTGNWDPRCDDASEALARACMKQDYDLCDLLIQEGVSLTLKHLPVLWGLKGSLEYVKKTIQHLKDTGSWNPRCDNASEALAKAYCKQEFQVCDLLIQEGVSLAMKHLPNVVLLGSSNNVKIFDTVKETIQHLKDADNWDPRCDNAAKALLNAFMKEDYDVCDLLIQEGVSLSMKHLPDVVFSGSLATDTKEIHHLKHTASWDPHCDDASNALDKAYSQHQIDVCNLPRQEGCSLAKRYFPHVVFLGSLEAVTKVIHHLKETASWDPQCDDASEALEKAYSQHLYDVCDLLRQEGVSLTVSDLSSTLLWASTESAEKAIKDFKYTNQLDSSSVDTNKILDQVKSWGKIEICDLLIKEGVCHPDLER